jgi:arylformamidase
VLKSLSSHFRWRPVARFVSRLDVRFLVVALIAALNVGMTAKSEAAPATKKAKPASAASSSCSTPTTVPFSVKRDVLYITRPGVDQRLTSLDVYPVLGPCPSPTLVWVHGGGWTVGDKANQMTEKIRWANGLGYTLVSVNYRLTADGLPTPVRYPDHNDDVAAAIRWLEANGSALGADTNRMALMGHSAGAAIVASVATDMTHLKKVTDAPSPIDCFVSVDTEGYDVVRVLSDARPGSENDRIYRAVFGADPAGWVGSSPITHVSETPSALLLTRGTRDRRDATSAFSSAMKRAGASVEVQSFVGLDHLEINSVIGSATDRKVTPVVTAFLQGCLSR